MKPNPSISAILQVKGDSTPMYNEGKGFQGKGTACFVAGHGGGSSVVH